MVVRVGNIEKVTPKQSLGRGEGVSPVALWGGEAGITRAEGAAGQCWGGWWKIRSKRQWGQVMQGVWPCKDPDPSLGGKRSHSGSDVICLMF